jgi:Na+-transporting methylmalonyl-CoA/oxaloacetate decarboxylase gamma subunit
MALHRSKTRVGFPFLLVLAIGCSGAFSARVAAQDAGDPAKARMQEMTRRELQLNNTVGEHERPSDPKRTQAMMDQVSGDFERILTLHNQMVRALGANQSLDYQFISDAAGEIRKRSTRLQSSLKLPPPEVTAGDRGPELNLLIAETRDEVVLLCKLIERFVKNPIIETPGTVDAQQLENARRDLQSVVLVSIDLKKRTDKEAH